MISPIPSATPIKPACATLPLPGIFGEVIEKDGTPTPVGEKGFMCITKPWPSMIRTIWNDPDRFVKSYFSECQKDGKAVYFTGDGAMVDEDGYITITGRTDDVINVSGHRIGTAEIEASIKKHPNVASVAVVGRPHEIKGEGIFAYVVLKSVPVSQKDEVADDLETIKEINAIIKSDIGAIALCDGVAFVSDLPKTRSGKIMRRILRSIVKGEKITQDTSTLENPDIVREIEEIVGNL
jgi:acetyl-CoA synthetase